MDLWRKVGQGLVFVIVIVIMAFAVKEVRDLLSMWGQNYPVIKEIGLYCLSAVLVLILSLIGMLIYYFSTKNPS